MTLGEFLKENKMDKPICILTLDSIKNIRLPMEYKKSSEVDAEFLQREYMEHYDDDGITEIWVM